MMVLFYDGGFFLAAGGLLVFGSAAIWQAIDCFRQGELRRTVAWSAATLPLFCAAVALAWFGAKSRNLDVWNNRGFGPDWECTNLGLPAADLCFQDAAARRPSAPSGAQNGAARGERSDPQLKPTRP